MSPVTFISYLDSQGEPFREGCERRIIHTSQLMTVVIDVANGPWAEADPYDSHSHEQITFVSEGELLFLVEGDAPRHLRAGDLVAVPSGQPHAIQLLSARARLVDSFNPVREDFLKGEAIQARLPETLVVNADEVNAAGEHSERHNGNHSR